MITSDTNFRGNFDSIEAVWEAIPYGGVEGDYLNIQGVKYRWNKYLAMWENAEVVTETPARETVTFDEDVNMQNDLTVAGVLRAKKFVVEDLPTGIEEVEITESAVSGGTNVITFTYTNGESQTFNIKNGEEGKTMGAFAIAADALDKSGWDTAKGYLVLTETDGEFDVYTYEAEEWSKVDTIEISLTYDVDNALSDSSEKPVQNKVITADIGKVRNYLGGDIRTLAVGQTFAKDEAVKTTIGTLVRITKEVKAMNTTDTVAIGDLKTANSKTWKALKAIAEYDEEGEYTNGDYAIKDNVVQKYDGSSWSAVTVANMYGDGNLYDEVEIADLISDYTTQNSVKLDIEKETTLPNNVSLSLYPTYKYYISPSNNTWTAGSTSHRCKLIPVSAGQVYIITADTGGRYAVLTTNTTSGSASYATGSSLVTMSADTTYRVTIPSNGAYLYIHTVIGGNNRTPKSVEVIKALKEIVDIHNEELNYSYPFFDVSKPTKTFDLNYFAYLPYYIDSNDRWRHFLTNSGNTYGGIMLDVRNCISAKIVNNDTFSISYAFLTTFDVGTDNTSVSYATGGDKASIASGTGSSVTLAIPDDAVCMWMGGNTNSIYSQGSLLSTITMTYKSLNGNWLKGALLDSDMLYSSVHWTTDDWTSGNVNPTNGSISSSANASYCKVPLDGVHGFFAPMYHVTTNIGIAFFTAQDVYISGIDYKNAIKGIHYAEVPSAAAYMLYTYNRTTYGEPFAGIDFQMYANKAAEYLGKNTSASGGASSSLSLVEKNILKKIDQYANIKWTALQNIDGTYITSGSQTGLPYSSTQEVEGAVDFNISIRTFMTATKNPYSLLYTESLRSNTSGYGFIYNTNVGSTVHGYMGVVCSTLTAAAIGMRLQYTTGFMRWLEKQGMFVKIYNQSAQGVCLGDLVWESGHISIISNVGKVAGEVQTIVRSEAFPPFVRKVTYTPSSFDSYLASEGRIIYRPTELYKNTFYEASPFVAVDDEALTEQYQYNTDIMTYKGDYACFREGFPIWINYNLSEVGDWTHMQVYKNDTLVDTYEIDPSIHKFNLTESYGADLGYGKWKARLTDGTNYSDYTYWEILQTTVSYETPDENNPDIKTFRFSSANATPFYLGIYLASGSPCCIYELTQAEKIHGEVTFDARKLSLEQRSGLTTGNAYLKVFFRGDYGMLSNGGLLTDY